MKIKKKYIGFIATGLSLFLSFYFLQEIYLWVINQNAFTLILLLIFFISQIYTIIYWIELGNKEKMAKEISRQIITDGNLVKQDDIKKHLYNKAYEEYYILNLFKGKNIGEK